LNEENEKKKEFLKSYQKAKRDVVRLERQLEELRLNKISPSVINDGMPHGTDIGDLSNYAAQVDKIEREIITARYERINAYQRVQKCIEAVEDGREKDLLTYRYLKGESWERVAVSMGYSWQHVNENKWSHQWCIVTMDGQTGYADGMSGIAGYGEMVSGMTLADGRTIYFPT